MTKSFTIGAKEATARVIHLRRAGSGAGRPPPADSVTRSRRDLVEFSDALDEAHSHLGVATELPRETADRIDMALAGTHGLLESHTRSDQPPASEETPQSLVDRIDELTAEILAEHPALAQGLLRLSAAVASFFR